MNRNAYLSFSALFLGWLYFFWPSIVPLFSFHWKDPYSYYIYALYISTAYLVFYKRKSIERVAFTSSQLGLLSLFIMSVLWVVASVSNLEVVKQIAVLLMLPAMGLTAFGPYVARVLIFPILYFTLLVPLYDPSFPWRQNIIWLAFGLFYAYLNFQTNLRRIIFVALTTTVSFILPLIPFSTVYVSILAVIVLLGIAYGMEEPKPEFFRRPIKGEQPGRLLITSAARWMTPTLIALSFMVSSPWLSENMRDFFPKGIKKIVLMSPKGAGDWQGPFISNTHDWLPIFNRPSATTKVEYQYQSTLNTIYLYSAYYDSDRSISELLDPKNALDNPEFWKLISRNYLNIEGIPIQELVLESEGLTRIQWSWYYILGVRTLDMDYMKILDKVRVISKYAEGSGVIAISTYYTKDPNEARQLLQSFLKEMGPSLIILERPELVPTGKLNF